MMATSVGPESVLSTETKSLVESNNNENEDEESIKHVSDIIGSWGKFQKWLFFYASIVYIISPFTGASLDYYMIKSDFWCQSGASLVRLQASHVCYFIYFDPKLLSLREF